jgi:hypothetical protein
MSSSASPDHGLGRSSSSRLRRQPLQPRAESINRLLSRWTEPIRRTLPESIAIRWVEDPEAGSAKSTRISSKARC